MRTPRPVPPAHPPAPRPPRQERSRRTLQRIVNAALELLAEEGAEGVTVERVVRRAGSSVGSFYARFRSKEELLRYLDEGIWTAARERWDAGMASVEWEERTTREVVEGIVSLLVRSHRADQRPRRALERAAGRWGAGGGSERARAFHRHVLRDVLALLLPRRGEILHADPGYAVTLGYWMVVGALQGMLEGEEDPSAEADERLASHLARAFLAYLTGGPGGGAAAEERADFFDPWE